MSEVLSQSQIDMLLNSLKEGDSGGEAVEKEPEKKVRKYDFYSPKKFTKDKLRILNDVFDKYARIMVSQINSLFRVSCENTIAGIEEQRYYEFSNALQDNDVLAAIDVVLPDNSKGKPILMHVTPFLMLSFMDRMMGGDGDVEDVDISYTYTDIERALYENIIRYLTEGLRDSWSSYIQLDFQFYQAEENTTMLQVIGLDETVVIITMDVDIGAMQGKISICFPGNLLSDVFTIYDRKANREKEKGMNYVSSYEDIMYSIKNSELEVKAKLGDVEVKLEDIYSLHPGDILNLNKPKDSDVEVAVAGNPWFIGQLGQQNNKMAVLIKDVQSYKESSHDSIIYANSEEQTQTINEEKK